ncbi:hypothetical protein SAMN05216593_11425 [Pseudomonas asturiensis]|uniref:Uncharacterized protein n=1 Tax=Pseudomonas asturiensis TaxID=1190415 RepID=A0A1M7PVW1_9PSED|nr:hypothetical protein [Pseudomonas asturiensis]SHN21711.1 hypothetical protein SAMN05216593_11425 [Pseudomonas asturiensis]
MISALFDNVTFTEARQPMKNRLPVMNPISMIAIFASLSEASATAVLPYLDEHNQQIYIWFLIAFPSALVLLFFLTINFNPKALYLPSQHAHAAPLHTPPDGYTCSEIYKHSMRYETACRTGKPDP